MHFPNKLGVRERRNTSGYAYLSFNISIPDILCIGTLNVGTIHIVPMNSRFGATIRLDCIVYGFQLVGITQYIAK